MTINLDWTTQDSLRARVRGFPVTLQDGEHGLLFTTLQMQRAKDFAEKGDPTAMKLLALIAKQRLRG